jgi:hypothetical protein
VVETPSFAHSPCSSISVVAGARNHLPGNRSLGFCFEIPV